MKQYLVFVELKGEQTRRLKGHIILKRTTADDAEQAVEIATKGRIFQEEGFEIIGVEDPGHQTAGHQTQREKTENSIS